MFDHYSVMLKESIELLAIKPNGVYLDMTLGGSGHSLEIAKQLNKDGKLICFDQDETAIENAKNVFLDFSNVHIIKANFNDFERYLDEMNIDKIDGVIFDLGVSSVQFDSKERGFSYRFDSKLDMRMDQDKEKSAYDIVNDYSFSDLQYILKKYGEEKYAKQIARKIEAYRADKKIETTFELVEIIKSSLPQAYLKKKGHPAKKIFQALRIEVNDELNVFEKTLDKVINRLNLNGRVVVITFHSLEDKICKRIFKEYTTSKIPKEIPILDGMNDVYYRLINSKVVIPSDDELSENRRSKSSKLRAIEKIR